MAKEILSNLPIPGSVTALSTLKRELKTGETELELEAALGEPFLAAAIQFRLVIGSEIVLVTKVDGTKKLLTITRNVGESSKEAAHAVGTGVFNHLTKEALERYILENPSGAGNVAIAYRNAAQKVSNGSKVKFDKAVKDPGANINLAEGFYTAPVEGYYHVDGCVAVKVAKNETTLLAAIYVNGIEVLRGVRVITSLGGEYTTDVTVSGIVFCKKGDKIELGLQHNAGVELTLEVGNEAFNNISVTPVAGEGKEGPRGGEGQVAIAYRKAAWKIKDKTWTKVAVDVIIKDPGNNITSGSYVVPASGYYAVTGVASPPGSGFMACAIYKNGSECFRGDQRISNIGFFVAAGMEYFNKGDTIELFVYTEPGKEETIAENTAPSVWRLTVAPVAGEGPRGATGLEGPRGGEGQVAIAYRGAALTLASGAPRSVKPDKVLKDPGGNFNIAEGFYKAPVTGYYQVNGVVSLSNVAETTTFASILIGGAEALRGTRIANVASQEGAVTVSGIIYVVAGEKIELGVYLATEQSLTVGSATVVLSVTPIAGEGKTGPTGPEGPKGSAFPKTETGFQATFGQATLKFSGTNKAELKVSHGLGKTPKFVYVTQDHQNVANSWPEIETSQSEYTSTEFRIYMVNVKSETSTGEVVVNWMAVG